MIAETGDIIDGLTIQQPADFFADNLTLNAGGEALFFQNATQPNGSGAAGYFTSKHSVLGVGDTVGGVSVGGVLTAVFNNRGQVAIVATSGSDYYLILATPVDGTPAPRDTTYKLQNGYGSILDLGWALHPGWGEGHYGYLYPFNSSINQQIIYTADGKLKLAADPDLYLYNDGGYLAVGPNGDTFTIDQANGAFTIRDRGLYLQSPDTVSPPNKVAFSSSAAYWALINASPVNSTP